MNAQTLSKIAIAKVADEALDRMVTSANENFTAGRITKVDLASWIIEYFEIQCFERCRERIQKEHFDEVTYLESVVEQLRKSRKEGRNTNKDIAALLLPLTSQTKPMFSKRKSGTEDNGELPLGEKD